MQHWMTLAKWGANRSRFRGDGLRGGSANLFFLPAAERSSCVLRQEQIRREMMLEGVISILEGMNPA